MARRTRAQLEPPQHSRLSRIRREGFGMDRPHLPLLRAAQPEMLDLVYGSRERNRHRPVRCGSLRAAVVFFTAAMAAQLKRVHGFLAEALARGFDVAMIGYTLAPEATLTKSRRPTTRSCAREAASYGVGTRQADYSGWSRRASSAMAMGLPQVDAGLASAASRRRRAPQFTHETRPPPRMSHGQPDRISRNRQDRLYCLWVARSNGIAAPVARLSLGVGESGNNGWSLARIHDHFSIL